MASATVGPSPLDRLTLESIPTVDLRLLTQSELTALSLCSAHAFDLRRCDDVVIPKIDRSVFNESAGSRKQTYSRLRLAPRNKPNLAPSKPRALTPELPVPDSERAENSRIISLFKSLFHLTNGIDFSSRDESQSRRDELALVPVSVTYCDTVPGPVNQSESVSAIDGSRKRKRGSRKSKLETDPSSSEKVEVEVEVEVVVDEGWSVSAEEEQRRWEEREKELINRSRVVVDLAELAKADDPYGKALRKMTEGKESAEELLGFVNDLEGQWGSRRKKRKIVDANVFGDALPNGWKVLIAVKKKQGRAWVFCRRYISPNGRYFVSCKEVSSYLLSLTGPQESKDQPTVQGPDISMVDNLASNNAADIETKAECQALPHSSQSNDHENRQLCLQNSPNQESQANLSKDMHLEVNAASDSALKCHKCSTPFSEKDELLNHLLSCNKRKRRKSGVHVEDDVIVMDGKYECQFCNKLFLERNSYFGHVGMHVKNYAKSIGGTPVATTKQKSSEPVSINKVPVSVSDTRRSANLNSEPFAGTPDIAASCELKINETEVVMTATPDAERNVENGKNDHISFSHHTELNFEAVHTGNSTMGVDEAADNPNVKPDDISGSDKVFFNDNDPCDNSQDVNATDCLSSEVIKSSAVVVADAEADLVSDSKHLDLGNDASFVTVNTKEDVLLPTELDLPVTNQANSSSQILVCESLVNKELEHSFCDEEVKVGADGRINGSGSGHIDIGMNDDTYVEDSRSLEESSAIPHREETCVVTVNKIEYIGSKASDLELERGSETRQTEIGIQNIRTDFTGLVNEPEVDLCTLESTKVAMATDRNSQGSRSEGNMLCFPKDYVSNYMGNEAAGGSGAGMVLPTGSRGFQIEQSCGPGNSTGEVSDKKGEEHTSNLFFASRSHNNHLDSNAMANNDQSHNDVSSVLGAFGSFVEDKQAQVPKSLFSCLSMNENSREVALNDVGNVSSTTTPMHLPELDKVESSRSNKSILDFSNMTEMDERFLSSVQHDPVPEESSPFQLWGQQSCGLEGNQTKVYGGVSSVTQQERASDNSSLNLVDLQRPSGGGYNLNEVCMNEQRYLQHNETGVFSPSSGARRDGMAHGNTLNLAGFHQQCDLGYNLNKPCINQQSYGVQHTESRAYGSGDQARQERVAYGNSLSLASAQQCDTRYNLNRACAQQTVDTGYSLNKGYIDSIQGLSTNIGNSRDRDLMIGFGDTSVSNQTATTEFLWRSTEGSLMPGGLVDSSASRGQSSGSFQAFDFLSDKGGNNLYTTNEKYDNMSSFEGLRSTVEPMEFSFMTQESNAQLQNPKVLQYNTEMAQSFGGSLWNQKTSALPNMMAGHVAMCVWCGTEFHQDPLACEMQAGSIGYLCPSCKARMSGQYL